MNNKFPEQPWFAPNPGIGYDDFDDGNLALEGFVTLPHTFFFF